MVTQPIHNVAILGQSITETASPETGEFDFLDYLLGLRSDALVPSDENPSVASPIGAQAEHKSGEALLGIFRRSQKDTSNSEKGDPLFTALPMLASAEPKSIATPSLTMDEKLTTFIEGERPDLPGSTFRMMDAYQQPLRVSEVTQSLDKHAVQVSPLAKADPAIVTSTNVEGTAGVTSFETKTPQQPRLQNLFAAKEVIELPRDAQVEARIDRAPTSNVIHEVTKQLSIQQQDKVVEQRDVESSQLSSTNPSQAMQAVAENEHQPAPLEARKTNRKQIDLSDEIGSTPTKSSQPLAPELSARSVSATPQPVVANVQVTAPSLQPKDQGVTVENLMQRVDSLSRNGGGKMTLFLHPPELGQVEISVTTRGKKVEVEMTSDNDATKSILESQLGDLKQSIQSQDLMLSKIEVHVGKESERFFGGTQFNTANFQNQQQSSHQSQQGQSQSQRSPWLNNQYTDRPLAVSRDTARPLMAARAGGVDVRI